MVLSQFTASDPFDFDAVLARFSPFATNVLTFFRRQLILELFEIFVFMGCTNETECPIAAVIRTIQPVSIRLLA